MTRASESSHFSRSAEFRGLAPLVATVFFGFLSVSVPLAALPLQIHDVFGFGTLMVGCVIGLQSLAAVATRHRAGTLCDYYGPRRAVLIGLPLAAVSGLFYLAAVVLPLGAWGGLAVILAGRVIAGCGESLFLTGAMSWGIGRIGATRTGKVMAWQGIALYAALGAGAPIGLAVQHAGGFEAVAFATMAPPLLAGLVAYVVPGVAALGTQRVPFHRVLGLIWRPGVVLTLATVPFAGMAAFLALDYAERGWADPGLALAGFGAAYILVRLFFAHLPDKLGGARVAAVSLIIEAAGQALLWLAPNPAAAFAGACLTGLGFSLIFPSMGVEATRRVAPDQRGRAVGNFIAFFDLAVGFTGPVIGLFAGWFGYSSIFLIGALATLAAFFLLGGVRRMAPVAATS